MNRTISEKTKNYLDKISAFEGRENLAQLIEFVMWNDAFEITTPLVNEVYRDISSKYSDEEIYSVMKNAAYTKDIKAALKKAMEKAKPELEKILDGNKIITISYSVNSGLSCKIQLKTPVTVDGFYNARFFSFRQTASRYSFSLNEK